MMGTFARLAQLMHEHPEIHELDINPLILYARGQGAAVADGRIGLRRVQASTGIRG